MARPKRNETTKKTLHFSNEGEEWGLTYTHRRFTVGDIEEILHMANEAAQFTYVKQLVSRIEDQDGELVNWNDLYLEEMQAFMDYLLDSDKSSDPE